MSELRNRIKIEMELRGYSEKTIKNYILHVNTFSKFYNKSPKLLGEEEIREYLNYCITVRKLSEVCNLKISDIDSQNMQIFVREGKGNKDIVPML